MTRDWRRVFRLDVGSAHVERDVDQELAFHVEMRARTLAASGLDPEAAEREARRRFGDVDEIRAECLHIDHDRERAVRRIDYVNDLRLDVVYALRALRQNAGFAIVVVLTLALGIGANTATFALIDALMLRALPVGHPEALVTVGNPARTASLSQGTPRNDLASYPLFADLRAQQRVFTDLYATGRTNRLDVLIERSGTQPEHPRGRFVTASFFAVLEVHPFAGRVFTPEEDRVPAGAPSVVISHRYWTTRFGGERSALGRTILVNTMPLTIVGIAPQGFTGDIVGQPVDLWIPVMEQPALMPNSPWLDKRDVNWLLIMGRLAPRVTLSHARSAIAAIENRSILEHVQTSERAATEQYLRATQVDVLPGSRGFSNDRRVFAGALYTLAAAVAVVLLIVCANVANLLLARAANRGREMSVRMALGAGRMRLVRQLLTESVLLATLGGAVGVLLALWGTKALVALTRGVSLDARINARVLAFALLLSLATAILFGLVPALRATRVELATSLRASGRGVAGRSGTRFGLGKLLVVGQVALSTLLLVGTGMLVRSVQQLQVADIGVARDRLVLVHVDAERAAYKDARLAALMRELLARAARVPSVAAASLSENGIFSGTESGSTVQVEGFTARAAGDTTVAADDVGPGYFHAIGAHILQGRDVESRDDETGAKVVVLNQTAARFFFPQGGALGRHVREDSTSFEIIGVVGDVEGRDLRAAPTRRMYFATLQSKQLPGAFSIEVRATGDPARVVDPLRRALTAVDPALELRVDPLTTLIEDSISQDQLVARVASIFGALALALAALGLYGVMTYATLRRTNEFGLRMALGAQPARVKRLVLGEALALVGGGAALGVPAALAASRLIRTQLFGVSSFDLSSIAIALAVLGASAVIAAYLPARRAARVGPLAAIRTE